MSCHGIDSIGQLSTKREGQIWSPAFPLRLASKAHSFRWLASKIATSSFSNCTFVEFTSTKPDFWFCLLNHGLSRSQCPISEALADLIMGGNTELVYFRNSQSSRRLLFKCSLPEHFQVLECLSIQIQSFSLNFTVCHL